MAPNSLAFVFSDSFGKPKDTDRRLIRSHCMRGKNKKIRNDSRQVQEKPQRQRIALPRPAPPPTDLALIGYASEIDHTSHMLIYESFTKAKHTLYPKGINVDFNISNALSFQWLLQDAAYLHCVLFCTAAVSDIISHIPLRQTSCFHLGKTISLLKERLSDETTCLLDSTVSIVTSLVIMSSVLGDHATATAHIAGLQQMVRLRGGHEAFRSNPKLHSKLTRVDLAFSLHTGQPPLFIKDENPRSSIDATASKAPEDPSSLWRIQNAELRAIFQDLQKVSEDLNNVDGKRRKLHFDEFQDISSSIQYRLLMLQGALTNLLDEAMRIGSLIFLTTTFQLPKGESRYMYLSSRLQECCCAIDTSIPERRDLVLWLLLIGAISLYGLDVPWLRDRWKATVPTDMTWHEARQRLKGILWVDGIHDKLGEYAFHVLSGKEVKELERDDASLWTSGWALCPFQL